MKMAVVHSSKKHQTTQCHNPEDMGSGVLGCGAVWLGECSLKIHRNTVPSSSMVKQSKKIGLHLLDLLDP
jgi:hypothetical protein